MPDPATSFNDYQDFTETTAIYPPEVALAYTACGMIGESCEYAAKLSKLLDKALKEVQKEYLNADQATRDEMLSQIDNLRKLRVIFGEATSLGNAAEKFKKALRSGDKKIPALPALSEEASRELQKELGDVQWYVAGAARAHDKKLSEVVAQNVEKLQSRKQRGVIHGEGDNR